MSLTKARANFLAVCEDILKAARSDDYATARDIAEIIEENFMEIFAYIEEREKAFDDLIHSPHEE